MKELTEKEITIIRKNSDNVCWNTMHSYYLPEDFIREFQNKVNWNTLSYEKKLSEAFIKEFQNKINWFLLSYNENLELSESFIRHFQNKFNWNALSAHISLSENSIIEFQDKVNWVYISIYQKLSEDFIRKFSKKLDIDLLLENPNISNELKETIKLLS